MTVAEMAERFDAYHNETNKFIFGEWCTMDIATRDARQAEIDAKHHYRHGWITVDGVSFSNSDAYPDREFVNAFD